MLIFRELTSAPAPTAVALGYFDGVHLGHRAVIQAAVRCKSEGLIPALFTFASTPKKGTEREQLTGLEDKIRIFEQTGVEILYIIEFEQVKNKTPEQFVTDILKNVFKAKKAFCGYNYHFGRNASAEGADLIRLCAQSDIEAGVIKPVMIGDECVSSSKIRRYLKAGDIKSADEMLGYDFSIVSESVEGSHIGTALGTPTINQRLDENRVLPRFGVYASEVFLDGERYAGVTNIGVKPTLGGNNTPNCETWLPLYEGGELYGKKVEVRLGDFIRPEKKFENLAQLQNAIKEDGKKVIKNFI